MDTPFLIRLGIVLVALAIVIALMARRQRVVRRAALGRPTLRRRVSTLPSGYRRQEARIAPLGYTTVGDYDLCDESGKRIHRMFVSWNEEASTLYVRGMHIAGYFARLDGAEMEPDSIVVQTSLFDVDWTPATFVVQTVRNLKQGSEPALIAVHEQAIELLGQRGWHDRRSRIDPVEFALAVLVDLAAARTEGTKRTGINVGRAARRTYADGYAQIGHAIPRLDSAELGD